MQNYSAVKKSIIMLAAAASLFMFSACRKITGEGPVVSEIRGITGFSGVSTGIAGRVNYTIAPEYKVELIAQRNILDVLETSVIGGHLLIKVKNGINIRNDEDIVANISAPAAGYLHVSGPGTLKVNGAIVSNSLDLGISGSGDIFTGNINITGKIDANISGSGNIYVKNGIAGEETLRISGSGKIKMDSVDAKKASITISGSGSMYLNISQILEATISGSGSVFYQGNAQVNTHISGSGKVIRL